MENVQPLWQYLVIFCSKTSRSLWKYHLGFIQTNKVYKWLLIWRETPHPSGIFHLNEISTEKCISLSKNKSFISEWISSTEGRSHFISCESKMGWTQSGVIFLHVESFYGAVPPRQELLFSLKSVCFYRYFVKECSSSCKTLYDGCLLIIRNWN